MKNWFRSQRWWLLRVAALPVHILAFVILSFVLIRAMPADPARAMLGQNFTEAGYLRMKAELGLDGSVWSQLWRYLEGLAHFNLGNSLFTSRPITTEIGARLPQTIELAVLALIGAVIFGFAISYFGAMHPRSIVGRFCRGYGAIAGAVPEYVPAIACVFIFVHGATLWLECTPFKAIDAGDHQIIVLEIKALLMNPDIEPMVFHRSKFHEIARSA
jgi:ABC-type dipeptide/oligopeptide/nickel transport system permease component